MAGAARPGRRIRRRSRSLRSPRLWSLWTETSQTSGLLRWVASLPLATGNGLSLPSQTAPLVAKLSSAPSGMRSSAMCAARRGLASASARAGLVAAVAAALAALTTATRATAACAPWQENGRGRKWQKRPSSGPRPRRLLEDLGPPSPWLRRCCWAGPGDARRPGPRGCRGGRGARVGLMVWQRFVATAAGPGGPGGPSSRRPARQAKAPRPESESVGPSGLAAGGQGPPSPRLSRAPWPLAPG